MSAKDVIDKMSDDDVINILLDLGSEEPIPVRDGMMFNTICHNHEKLGKKKLHYHYESKTFYCYTQCHQIGNIFNLVMKAKECSYHDAYEYVCSKTGINTSSLKYGFTEEKIDNTFVKKFEDNKEKEEKPKVRDEKVLNKFWKNLFHESWIKDHISIDVMKMFKIRFDISGNRIIIPHYNEHNELIGIRCRNLDRKKVEDGKKYMPIVISNEVYSYLTSLNLYGLNINLVNIIKYRRVIIGEAEKFVMQHRTYYEESVAVAICGSALSDYHIQLLLKYNVEEVILALDKEFENEQQEKEYMEKIQKSFVNKLIPYFSVSIIWDSENEIDYKMSPTDKGKKVYESLFKKRIQM